MGGNATAIDIETNSKIAKAEKLNLSKVSKENFVKYFTEMFSKLNSLYKLDHGELLWSNFNIIKDGSAFNGSSEQLFDSSISHEEFFDVKPKVGDIDVTIPSSKLPKLWNTLLYIQGVWMTDNIVYIGQNKKSENTIGHQINAIFELNTPYGYSVNVQIDFEGVGFKDDKPNEFAKFSHSSSMDDMKKRIKGVFHKYGLMSLIKAKGLKHSAILVTPKSRPDKYRIKKVADDFIPSMFTFSVDKGFRTRLIPFLDDYGEQIIIKGKYAFKEKSPKDSKYIQNIDTIFRFLFEEEPIIKNKKLLWSFVGLLELADMYCDKSTIEAFFKRFIIRCWGKTAQKLEREDGDGEGMRLDFKIKSTAVEEFVETFPFLKPIYKDFDVDQYYSNY